LWSGPERSEKSFRSHADRLVSDDLIEHYLQMSHHTRDEALPVTGIN